jgi:hypothetical protein
VSFSILIRFDDNEMEVLQRVIAHYLRVCQCEIKQGGSVPFIAHSGWLKHFRRNIKKQMIGKVVIFESEMQSLRAAFSDYLSASEQKIATGMTEPFLADRDVIEKMWERMSREMHRVMFVHPDEWWQGGGAA